MRALAVAAVVAGVVALAAAAHADSAQQRFAAATALEAKGQFADAAAALEALGHEQPNDSFAPDALFEAAVLEPQFEILDRHLGPFAAGEDGDLVQEGAFGVG